MTCRRSASRRSGWSSRSPCSCPSSSSAACRCRGEARDWYVIGVAGVLLLGVNYALLFWGAQFIPSGLTAVLRRLTPAFALVFGHFLLDDEPFTFKALGAIAIGVAGVAIISWDQLHLSRTPGAARLRGRDARRGLRRLRLRVRQGAQRGRRLRPEVLTCGQMLCAVGPMLAFAAVREGNPLAPALDAARRSACLLYLALAGSVAGTWLNYWLLERMSATALLSMALVEPLIAVLLGAAFLHERVTPGAAAGGVLVLCSIFMITMPFRRSRT